MEIDVQELYTELRRIAALHFRRDGRQLTLQPTVIVNEAYIRMQGKDWRSKTHYLATASRVMRNVVVDYARTRLSAKRGAGGKQITLSFADNAATPPGLSAIDVIALERALGELEALDARKARVVELRWYGGLEVEEIANVLDTSPATVKRDWEFSRTWLYKQLTCP